MTFGSEALKSKSFKGMMTNRRNFIKTAAAGFGTAAFYPLYSLNTDMNKASLFFNISLAEWSLNKALFKGEIDKDLVQRNTQRRKKYFVLERKVR